MPFKPPVVEKCPKCGKAVYQAEEKLAAGRKFHKMCLKCGLCQKMLESTNLAEHEGEIFCKQCYGRKYGPKGYGFGGGAGALCMDKGEHFGNVSCEMSGLAVICETIVNTQCTHVEISAEGLFIEPRSSKNEIPAFRHNKTVFCFCI